MKIQYIGRVVVFLVVALFVYIFTISPSFITAKAVVGGERIEDGELLLGIKVCPSFWFDEDHRDNRDLKLLFRANLAEFIQNKYATSTSTPASSWRVKALNLDSEILPKDDYQADGRCRDISARLYNKKRDYEPTDKGRDATSILFQDKSILRIGVRDHQGYISELDPKTKEWRGAAVDFGRLIAAEIGRKAVFTSLKSLDSRFFALRYGVADLSISLISFSEERANKAYLSQPYYSTGLILGTFLPGEEAFLSRSRAELNLNQQTILAVQGSSSIEFIRTHYPKSNIVTTTTSAEIPEYARNLMADSDVEDIFFVTDELIARGWTDSRLVYVDGKRLLTNNDSYVVATADTALLELVNRVIASGAVSTLYGE
jgi:ABC-type amino acid transport substrate-binding protein